MQNQPGVSFGSGTNLLGANASQLLGMPGAMQQSPASAGYQPGTLPPPSQPMQAPTNPTMANLPGAIPQQNQLPMGNPQMPQPQQGVVGMPPAIPESTKIIEALIKRMELQGKHESAVRDHLFPQQQRI